MFKFHIDDDVAVVPLVRALASEGLMLRSVAGVTVLARARLDAGTITKQSIAAICAALIAEAADEAGGAE